MDKIITDSRQIKDMSFSKIAIVGLGYVGLPLSLQFARSGVFVLGLDIDHAKVEAINAGRSYIKHISAEDIQQQNRKRIENLWLHLSHQ